MTQKPNIPVEKSLISETVAVDKIETSPEQAFSASKEAGRVAAQEEQVVPAPSLPTESPAAASAVQTKDPGLAAIESILAEGLEELYGKMAPSEQQVFKKRGEEVASTIRQMIQGAKVKMSKVLSLIRGWLGMIPGVNKYFLEQEAKIKADKILAQAEKKEGNEIQ